MIPAYTHNAMGQRVAKTVGAATTHFLYGPGGLIGEADGDSGAVQAEYVWLGGMPLAYIQGGAVYYIHPDHLGTPQRITGAGGALVWDASYTPFGEASVTGTLTFNLRFPGQYHDAETGLHQNGFRDYDPATGRYIQSDPIGLAAGLNTYGYVGGNPLASVDRSGLIEIFVGGLGDGSHGIVRDYMTDVFMTKYPQRKTEYFEWTEKAELIDFIKELRSACPEEPINLIGHSFGGDSAADVATELSGLVDMLVTVDPVSRAWSHSADLSDHVGEWNNINAASGNWEMSNFVAWLGGAWGDWSRGKAAWHYDVNADHEQFSKMMGADFMGKSVLGSMADYIASTPAGTCKCIPKRK